MKRFTFGSVSAALIAISLVWACSSVKGRSRSNSEDGTAELRSLQKELIATLSQKVEVLTTQYHTGGTDYDQVYIAQLELCDAKLDATEKSDERIALLEEQLRIAEAAQKLTEERKNSARATDANVLSAKSLYLKIKIRLVRERAKQKAKAD
jgi:hypothetical protein